MDKTGNSLNAPHLADWLTGPCDAQPSYLCSSNHRWSQYRGPCAASGHSVTRWLSRGGTKTPSRRSLRRQVSAVGGMRPLLPPHFPFRPPPPQTGPGEAAGAGGAPGLPALAAQLAPGPTVTAHPALGLFPRPLRGRQPSPLLSGLL